MVGKPKEPGPSDDSSANKSEDLAGRFLRQRNSRWRVSLAISVVILALLVVASASIGYVRVSPEEVLALIVQQLPYVGQLLAPKGSINQVDATIILQIRLPRVVGGIMVGSALAASGAVLQDVFSNPLADPFVTGVSSGAALGAALSIVLGLGAAVFGLNSVIAMAFVGGILSVGVSLFAAGYHSNSTTFLLTGVTMTFLTSAGVAYLTVLAGNKLPALVFWLMGGLGTITWSELAPTLPIVVFGLAGILYFSHDLNAMLFGDEQARSLGVNTGRVRALLVALVTLITATSVSISGIIGFVGLIIPHAMRLVVGSDHRVLLPSSMVVGGSFLLLADTVARTVALPIEIPVGVVTAAVGGPLFIYLLRGRRGHGYG